jgi:DNA-binding NtrC family response regulator
MMRRSGDQFTPALNGARVLVVEDEFLILLELESALVDAGAEIAAACRTVKDALPIAEGDSLSAAVLDVQVGGEFVAPVAQRLADRGIPIVFYTGQIGTDRALKEWPKSKTIFKPAGPQAIIMAILNR